MRNISQLVASMMLLATQANVPLTGNVAAAVQPSATTAGLEVRLHTNTASAVEIVASSKPDYDAEVLVPLRTAQEQARIARAQAAARAAAVRKASVARVAAATRPVVIAGTDVWAKLRLCEAGGDYTRNSGNGFYGAYQFDIRTWGNYGGYARADLAPAAVQDAKAQATQAARGWKPWPACARKLGLM
jgi:hypothetical protein